MFSWQSHSVSPTFLLSALSSCVMESFLLLYLPLLLLNLLSFYHDCELRLCETLAFFFYSHLSFWNLRHLYSTIRFHPLFGTILIVPFWLLFRTFSFLLHRLSSSIPPFTTVLPSLSYFSLPFLNLRPRCLSSSIPPAFRYNYSNHCLLNVTLYPFSCSATLVFFLFIVVRLQTNSPMSSLA